MTYENHFKVKPSLWAPGFATGLKDTLSIAELVTKRNDVDAVFLSEGDTVNQKVRGTLPVRHYALRNDRSQPIVTDTYRETTVKITLDADRVYSAVKVTDEQKKWDFADGLGDLLMTQAEVIGGYIDHRVLAEILNAPYERVIAVDDSVATVKAKLEINQDVYFNAFDEAVKSMKLMRTPSEKVVALAGAEFASRLRRSQKLVKVQGTGDDALSNSTLGSIAGVTVVESNLVPSNEVRVFLKSAVVLYTAASDLPASAPFAKAVNAHGYAMRHIMDYDSGFLSDRSVFDALFGTHYTKDRLEVITKSGQTLLSDNEYFVRGVKLVLGTTGERKPGDGSTDTAGGDPNSYLAKIFNGQEIDDVEFKNAKPWPLGGNYPGDKYGAKASAEVAGGKVSKVVIDGAGLGYTSTPAVTFSAPGGTGNTTATGVAVVANGQVTDIVITNVGKGYTEAPTITIAAP